MSKTALRIDYSNICKGYNTMYLDRDNKDPDTTACMNAALSWLHELLVTLTQTFSYHLYHLSNTQEVPIKEVASKRFMFYSLEKEITLQSYTLQRAACAYANSDEWVAKSNEGLLLLNDDEGACVTFYGQKESEAFQFLLKCLHTFTLEQYEL